MMTGIMSAVEAKNQSLLEELRAGLAKRSASSNPEQILQAMSEAERQAVLAMAMQVQRAMLYGNASAADVLQHHYPNTAQDRRQLVIAILGAEDAVPNVSKAEVAHDAVYAEWDKLPHIADVQGSKPARGQTTAVDPQAQPQPDFLEALIQSESSGNPQASYTTRDGRTFAGLLQFGEARLADYRRATGESFTQHEFVQDLELQQRVGQWHVADIGKAIDALDDAADGYDRDGLTSVAHLGGITGMRRFVQSAGTYNPSDELGTSLQDYYERFSGGAS
ncbi:hypothetical protein [Roseicyclus sp.]|uniref:hypothetical protein n=1 Tax=Roseicyclus sp. TaxID=1914329 RepID=UPI003F6A306F